MARPKPVPPVRVEPWNASNKWARAFSEKARDHLFEAFQGSTRTGGTGLGLAIAAELVRAHGGEIRLVEGTIGATFRLTIPDRAVELSAHRGARALG